jgi:hypothetical protein
VEYPTTTRPLAETAIATLKKLLPGRSPNPWKLAAWSGSKALDVNSTAAPNVASGRAQATARNREASWTSHSLFNPSAKVERSEDRAMHRTSILRFIRLVVA